MKRAIVALVIFLATAGLTTEVFAQEKLIRLKDGSVIRGEVLGKSGDIYKIKSPAFGFLSLRKADISSIEDPEQEKPALAAPQAATPEFVAEETPVSAPAMSATADWKGYQEKIMADPESMAAIQALAQNQEIIDIVSDPKLREAIFTGNIEYLKNNEKFMRFSNNPTVQKITEAAIGPKEGEEHAGKAKNQSGE
jgi:hypothetical protein